MDVRPTVTGRSIAGIARELNDHGVALSVGAWIRAQPPPQRGGWTLRTVATILANPATR